MFKPYSSIPLNYKIDLVKIKDKIIEDVKRELLHGQLKRNILVTQEIANLTKGNTLLDAEGLRILAYSEDILKDISEDNRKSIKLY